MPGHIDDIYPYFMRHAKQIFPMLDCMEDLRKISDLRVPADWYVWCCKARIRLRPACTEHLMCWLGTQRLVPSRERWSSMQVPPTVGKPTTPSSGSWLPSLGSTVAPWSYWPTRSLRRATQRYVCLLLPSVGRKEKLLIYHSSVISQLLDIHSAGVKMLLYFFKPHIKYSPQRETQISPVVGIVGSRPHQGGNAESLYSFFDK